VRDAPVVREGSCHAIFAFDVGKSIRVEDCATRLGGNAERVPPAGPGRPPYLQFDRPPVRADVAAAAIDVGATRTAERAHVVLYEFGAIAVVFVAPAAGRLEDLARIGASLGGANALSDAARALVADVVGRLGDAVEAPNLSPLAEDYLAFHVRAFDAGVPPSRWAEEFPAQLAAVLRSESCPLSDDEVRETLDSRASFTPDDVVLVDWNASLVVRETADDVLAVLTFATVQLLEMRYLDERLDDALERAYDAVERSKTRRSLFPSAHRGALEDVARREIDAARLFEHVRNAPKLLGDQFLARVYEHAAHRFRLRDWDDSLHRKIDVVGTIYERLRDRGTTLRAEVLEWIVIILIFVSIAIPFLVSGAH